MVEGRSVAGQGNGLMDRLIQRGALRRWACAARGAAAMDLHQLRQQRLRATDAEGGLHPAHGVLRVLSGVHEERRDAVALLDLGPRLGVELNPHRRIDRLVRSRAAGAERDARRWSDWACACA